MKRFIGLPEKVASFLLGERLSLGATDTYVRLALRAQSQCRATAEALAEIKNPRPVAFVRQANISNGPQQVNNGIPAGTNADQYAQAHAHSGEKQSAQNELLEDGTDGRTQLDSRPKPAIGSVDKGLEPVEAVNRPAH